MTTTTTLLPTGRRWAVLAVCAVSMFLIGLDTTIVNIALPAIGADIRTDTRGLEWVVDAYTLVLASLLITAGATADRFGRRRVFRIGLVVFGIGSIACALAPTLGALVVARAVQGIGAAMLSPVALAIVVDVMPDPRERARAIGIWAAVFGVSMAAGPTVGGVLVAEFGWRSVFWVNVPILVAALTLTYLVVPESRAKHPRRLDVRGQLALTVAVCCGIATLVEGPHVGWGSTPVLATGLIAAAATAAFLAAERRGPEPMIELDLFTRPAFASAALGAVGVFVALNATLLANTLELQTVRGWTALESGLAALPLAIGAAVCAPLSGRWVARFGARVPLVIAGAFLSTGGMWLGWHGAGTGLAELAVGYLLVGIGFGFANAPITNTAVSGLPRDRAGVAGAITSTARQLGAAIGIAVAGALLSRETASAPTLPVWLVVAGCGLFLFVVAWTAGAYRAESATASTRRS